MTTHPRTQLSTLVAADLRRMGWRLFGATGAVIMLAAVATFLGMGNTGFVVGLVIASLFMQPFYVALQMVKDKVDGTLEFLCSLPVSSHTLAASRVLLCGALALISGVGTAGVAVMKGLPATLGEPTVVVAFGAFLIGTAVPTAMAAVILALSTTLSFEVLGSLPIIMLMAVMVMAKVLGPFVDAEATLRALLAQPSGKAIILSIALTTLLAVMWIAFATTVRALERFRPEPRAGGR